MIILPDIRQASDFDCGRAAVACVLKFWGVRADLNKLQSSPHEGTHPYAVEQFLRTQAGLRALAGELDVECLKFFTAKGWPVICVLTDHWVVANSVSRGRVYFQCPNEGPANENISDWSARWCDFDRFSAAYHQYGIAVWTE